MKMTTWAAHYLRKFNPLACHFFGLILLISLCLPLAQARVETSHLFVALSDAMAAVKRGEAANSLPYLTALQQDFEALPSHQSPDGQAVSSALNIAMAAPNLPNFEQLAKALYRFEKAQNPVDYAQKRQQFAKRVLPVYQQLAQAIQRINSVKNSENLDEISALFNRFNRSWTANEKVVRESSLAHYGQIETAMSLFRIAMLSDPPNLAEMQQQAVKLGEFLADFKQGNAAQLTPATNAVQTLPDGIQLLEKSAQALAAQNFPEAKAAITQFIQQWVMFEGEVRTRDSALYTQIESELPLLSAKMTSQPQASLAALRQLIASLQQLDVAKAYSAFDAMLILLREGLEALLILMALLTALNAAQQPKAKRWVYAGAATGLLASLLGAVALQQLFPAISAGANREKLEGIVGVAAVLMMLFIGAWLHRKSSTQGWQQFVDKQLHHALATGSLLSMFSLSFLSVFREGAETVLFYAGMLPLIALEDLLLGLALALGILAIIAAIMAFSSKKLPIPLLFKGMTLLIYGLGFKILGVSIHTLQLTQLLPSHALSLPNTPLLGFYATIEGISAQLIYLALIPVVGRIVAGRIVVGRMTQPRPR